MISEEASNNDKKINVLDINEQSFPSSRQVSWRVASSHFQPFFSVPGGRARRHLNYHNSISNYSIILLIRLLSITIYDRT